MHNTQMSQRPQSRDVVTDFYQGKRGSCQFNASVQAVLRGNVPARTSMKVAGSDVKSSYSLLVQSICSVERLSMTSELMSDVESCYWKQNQAQNRFKGRMKSRAYANKFEVWNFIDGDPSRSFATNINKRSLVVHTAIKQLVSQTL